MAQVQFTSHLSEDICYNLSTSFLYWVGLTSDKRAITMPINKYNYHTLWDNLPCWSLLSFTRFNKTINYFSFLEVCWASTYTMRSWSSMRRLPSQVQIDFSKSSVPKSLQRYLQFWKATKDNSNSLRCLGFQDQQLEKFPMPGMSFY